VAASVGESVGEVMRAGIGRQFACAARRLANTLYPGPSWLTRRFTFPLQISRAGRQCSKAVETIWSPLSTGATFLKIR
jgi:hypothetical protein